jgi:hypothetical protein
MDKAHFELEDDAGEVFLMQSLQLQTAGHRSGGSARLPGTAAWS